MCTQHAPPPHPSRFSLPNHPIHLKIGGDIELSMGSNAIYFFSFFSTPSHLDWTLWVKNRIFTPIFHAPPVPKPPYGLKFRPKLVAKGYSPRAIQWYPQIGRPTSVGPTNGLTWYMEPSRPPLLFPHFSLATDRATAPIHTIFPISLHMGPTPSHTKFYTSTTFPLACTSCGTLATPGRTHLKFGRYPPPRTSTRTRCPPNFFLNPLYLHYPCTAIFRHF